MEFELPRLASAEDAGSALAAITAAVGAGELTPAGAGELFKLIAGFARLREATIFEQQLARLERAVEKSAPQINQICQVGENNHGAEP